MSNKNILIAYFSHAGNNYVGGSIVNLKIGNTEIVAKRIEQLTGGDLFKIDPIKKYSEDYDACTKEAQEELRVAARPEIIEYQNSLDRYKNIILAYPNWWGTLPMPVFTFLEKYDFTSKTILPLCTHEGSGMGRSESDIQKVCQQSIIQKGLPIRGSNVNSADKEIINWLKALAK